MNKLFVSEIFGPTLQGEGTFFGQPCFFIRLSGCNLRCEWTNKDGTYTKCDTPYTSWNAEGEHLTVEQIVDRLDMLNVFNINNVVITGGEPFLQKNVVDLINVLSKKYSVTVETNGTIYRENNAQLISISPKLSSSTPKTCIKSRNIHVRNRVYDKTINEFYKNNKCQIKFVYSCEDDIIEINKFVKKHGIKNEDVYLMPQGDISKKILENTRSCFEACIKNNYNMTHRLHILAYEDKREV
jgi:7-carboxy-7-deazaguanine synthase